LNPPSEDESATPPVSPRRFTGFGIRRERTSQQAATQQNADKDASLRRFKFLEAFGEF